MVHPDNRVEYEFWYSSILDIDSDRLADIALYNSALEKNVLFTPRVLTYSCPSCSQNVKQDHCLADGRYCPFFPKHALEGGMRDIRGNQLMLESLRQKCLYEQISSDNHT
jgi:hypothetical protein